MLDPEAVIRWLDLSGVFFNAILGGVVAREHRLDPIGFAVLAVLSGLGGGIIRDTLLQAGPPVAFTDNAYVFTALVGAAIAFSIRLEGRAWDRAYPPIDALALGVWAVVGAQKTLAVGLGPLAAIILGMVTAVGGGFVRDMVLRRIPTILGGSTLYATCALAAAGVAVLLTGLGLSTLASFVATAVGAGLCLLARYRGWVLPAGTGWRPPRPSFRRILPRRKKS
ncbi:trimeric intracellular cation channel family protein [Ruania zhangjianzhongii]|uniref:trimeric intracellular cation channel family protein n=1 Tax=Ruania zhangjianzhongii TaxID=2603206 RepID=UPI0011C75EDE|nr:trimeric intracellular cation channel family protein [Ruania zhangjianzhongii]